MKVDPVLPQSRLLAMKSAGLWRDQLLLEDLDRWVARVPERIAAVDHNSQTGERTVLSYAELGQRADKLAIGLAQLGIRRGDVISYQSPNWWQFVALHLAALRVGAISNPLMPIFRERELSFMLRQAESRLLVVPRRFRGFDHYAMAEALRAALPMLEHVLVVGGEGEAAFENLLDGSVDTRGEQAQALFAERRPTPDDVIQLLYTSGTTGEPKGVMHTSNTLFSAFMPMVERFALGSSDAVLMASPIAHQTGFIYGMMMPIHLGCKAVFQDLWDPKQAFDLIAAEQVTFTMGATPFLSDLTDEAERRGAQPQSLRVFVSAGAPIPRALVRRANAALDAHIISAWGMTENGAVTTTRPGDPPQKTFETDGCPIAGMELRAVDENGRPLPPDREGRLQVRGSSNFVGYLKHPEWYGTDAGEWFDTGDLARIDADGYVRITGRTKDIIIRGGENIPVVEVEQLIYQHPAILEVAVVAMPDPRLGERACAFVTLREGAALTLRELIDFLERRKLARNYLPERLEVLPNLPKTPSGKIQKVMLRVTAKELAVAGAPDRGQRQQE
jgi:cyclohexanecarboxylate-CoA ligase